MMNALLSCGLGAGANTCEEKTASLVVAARLEMLSLLLCNLHPSLAPWLSEAGCGSRLSFSTQWLQSRPSLIII